MSTNMSPVPNFSLRSDPFQNLVHRLSEMLGSSGIDADHVSEKELCDIMKDYDSKPEDWMPLISKWPDATQPYVRNLVDNGNGKYNLLILVWKPDSGSRIHDHTKHCCMKILQGALTETLFGWPDEDLIKCGQSSPPMEKKSTLMSTNQVAYISNSMGLHSMWNPSATDFAVSLHLYTPPAVVCRIFDGETGESEACRL